MIDLKICALTGEVLVPGELHLHSDKRSTQNQFKVVQGWIALKINGSLSGIRLMPKIDKALDGLYDWPSSPLSFKFLRYGSSMGDFLHALSVSENLDWVYGDVTTASVTVDPEITGHSCNASADVSRLRAECEKFDGSMKVKLVGDLKNTYYRKDGDPDFDGMQFHGVFDVPAAYIDFIEPRVRLSAGSQPFWYHSELDKCPPAVPIRSKNFDSIILSRGTPYSGNELKLTPARLLDAEKYNFTTYRIGETSLNVRPHSEPRQAPNGYISSTHASRTHLELFDFGYKRLVRMLGDEDRANLRMAGSGIGCLLTHPDPREQYTYIQNMTECTVEVERHCEGLDIKLNGCLEPLNDEGKKQVAELGPKFQISLFVSRAYALAQNWGITSFAQERRQELNR